MFTYFSQIIVFILCTSCMCSQSISMMTYNIRYGLADDGENSWDYRKEFLSSQINDYNPDFLGIQEALPFQLSYLDSLMPLHQYIGKSRDANGKGEYVAILYNNKKFDLLKEHTFWLSPTPTQASKGWDAAYPRICTYGLFKDKKSKRKIWVFNTHLDHKGAIARKESARLIVKEIQKVNTANYPLFLMGDFNAEPNSDPISLLDSLLIDTKELSKEKPLGPDGTFNNFEFHKLITRRIDYIFTAKNNTFTVQKFAVLSDSKDLKYPSDHLPVFINFNFIN